MYYNCFEKSFGFVCCLFLMEINGKKWDLKCWENYYKVSQSEMLLFITMIMIIINKK